MIGIVAIGLGLMASALEDGNLYLLALGLLMATTGLLGVAAAAADLRYDRRRPGLVLGRTEAGEPATIARRSRLGSVLPALGYGVTVLALLLVGLAALLDQVWVPAIAVLLVGGYLAPRLLPFVRGRVDPGGVWLAASGVTHVRDGSCWQVGWDDLLAVSTDSTVGLVLADGATVVRADTGPWGRRSLGPVSDRVLVVESRQLALEGEVLAFLLDAYRHDPGLRRQLGTPESLQWEVLGEPTGR